MRQGSSMTCCFPKRSQKVPKVRSRWLIFINAKFEKLKCMISLAQVEHNDSDPWGTFHELMVSVKGPSDCWFESARTEASTWCLICSWAFLRLASRIIRRAVMSAGLTPPTLLAWPIVCGLTWMHQAIVLKNYTVSIKTNLPSHQHITTKRYISSTIRHKHLLLEAYIFTWSLYNFRLSSSPTLLAKEKCSFNRSKTLLRLV